MTTLSDRWRTFTLAALGLLACIVFVVQLHETQQPRAWVRAVAFCVPLWLPLWGIVRHDRHTYKWATLCVLPYFVVAFTEAIADPAAMVWATSMVLAALLWFASLVGYLRATRAPR